MIPHLTRFIILFAILILGSYGIHVWVSETMFPGKVNEVISWAYLFNGIFTFICMLVIIRFSKKFKDQIGFIFLAASFIKTGIFVGLIKLNTIEMTTSMFLDFFIPYSICLGYEVYYTSKLLKEV